MTSRPAYVYLHGFASGPSSSKAQFFRSRFADLGMDLLVPQLDEGDFETLTITGQLGVVERATDGGPVVLIGSSLGGWLSALFAHRHPEVRKVVLLAPAFGFVSLLPSLVGAAAMRDWEDTGELPVHHFATGTERRLWFRLLEDARRYPEMPRFSQPGLILHGTLDESVPLQNSVRFVQENPNVRLVPVQAGHEMTDALDRLWTETRMFLELPDSR